MSYAKDLCAFIDASPTPFHAVLEASKLLEKAGVEKLDEKASWTLKQGKAYYVIRDDASLVAFRLGLKSASECGFALSGAHCDAPALRARINKSVFAHGYERVAVEAYGSLIHSTWLDRPLSLAGKVVFSNKGQLESAFVNLNKPVAVIPNLAIHFNREMNKGVEYSLQDNLLPLVAVNDSKEAPKFSWIIRVVAQELKLEPEQIISADLSFIEAGKAIVFGDNNEIISSPRIDNLEGCHAVLTSFIDSKASSHGQIAIIFDNEEIGSGTMRGAASCFLRDIIERIVANSCSGEANITEAVQKALAQSLSVSVDGAQAWHPAYAAKCDEDFGPMLNRGPAIKSNANVKYATDAFGEALFRSYCEKAQVPWQRFKMRADMVPGSTIGPISSAMLGVRTIDVGVPMLSMHSARETAGVLDHDAMIKALTVFYNCAPNTVNS